MAANEEAAGKAGETIASEFVSALGLTDVMLGGIAVYAHYLSHPPTFSARFATTGHNVLDVALLVGAAALVGKVITLIVAVLMALINILLRRLIYAAELQQVLATYWTATRRIGSYTKRPVEVAVAAIRIDNTERAKRLDIIRAHAIIAHGSGLLTLTYAKPLSEAFNGVISSRQLDLVGIAFIILGILQQADRISQAMSFMRAVASPQTASETTHGDNKIEN